MVHTTPPPFTLPPGLDWGRIDEQAHQLETQRQTLVVQHTIALNATLQRVQVPEAVRAFLLEVWVEALAEADARPGADGELAQALRQTGQELVRIASARRKHDRKLRYGARLPVLLPRLQQGMALVCLDTREQDHHLQALQLGMGERMAPRTGTDPTDAWSAAVLLLSRREPHVDGYRLRSHRDLDDQALRVLTHHDHLRLHAVTHGGLEPDARTLERVRQLKVGERFWRKRNPLTRAPVQLEWLGGDGQLCLLCDDFHTGYLYHRMRLARHLQSGILTRQAT